MWTINLALSAKKYDYRRGIIDKIAWKFTGKLMEAMMSVEELSQSVKEQFLFPIPKVSETDCVSGKLFTAWVMQESLKDKKRELYKSEHFSHAAFVEFGMEKIKAVWCVRENVQIIHIFTEEDCNVLTKLSDERGEWNTGYHILRDRLQSPDVDFGNFCMQDFMQGIS